MTFFIPLAKIDEEKRLVIGRAVQEVVDRSNEIIDYATAKPAFQKWSAEFEKISGGLSKGNLRVMHDPKKVAGKLTDLSYDDEAKAIDVVAKVVDDDEWKKVIEGVYTGFSVGGGYGAKWKDPATGAIRYTPVVTELSLVDNPCIPTARIAELHKADGSTVMLPLAGRARSFDEIYRPARSFDEVLAGAPAVRATPDPLSFEAALAKMALPFTRRAGMRAMMAGARSARATASAAVENSARRAGAAAYDRAAFTAARSETDRMHGGRRQAGQKFRPSITSAQARRMAEDAASTASGDVRRNSVSGIRAARALGAMRARDEFNAAGRRTAKTVAVGAGVGAAGYAAYGLRGRSRELSQAELEQRREAGRASGEKRRRGTETERGR